MQRALVAIRCNSQLLTIAVPNTHTSLCDASYVRFAFSVLFFSPLDPSSLSFFFCSILYCVVVYVFSLVLISVAQCSTALTLTASPLSLTLSVLRVILLSFALSAYSVNRIFCMLHNGHGTCDLVVFFSPFGFCTIGFEGAIELHEKNETMNTFRVLWPYIHSSAFA